MKIKRIKATKIDAYMKKHGYKDAYEMKDKLLYKGIQLVVIPNNDKEKMWLYRKKRFYDILSTTCACLYLPIYLLIAYAILPLFKLAYSLLLLLALAPVTASFIIRNLFEHELIERKQ